MALIVSLVWLSLLLLLVTIASAVWQLVEGVATAAAFVGLAVFAAQAGNF